MSQVKGAPVHQILACVSDCSTALMLRLTLADEGYEVVVAEDCDCAAAAEEAFDAVIVDLEAWSLHENGMIEPPDLSSYERPVVAISTDEPARVLLQTGADAALRKPFDGPALARVLRQLR